MTVTTYLSKLCTSILYLSKLNKIIEANEPVKIIESIALIYVCFIHTSKSTRKAHEEICKDSNICYIIS